MISNGNKIEQTSISGSNRATDFKLQARLSLNCKTQSPITN